MLIMLVASAACETTSVAPDAAATVTDASALADAAADAGIPDAAMLPDAAAPDATPPRDVGPIDAGEDVVEVLVTLDDMPAADTLVLQGGTEVHQRTNASGVAFVTIDRAVAGDVWILASHPMARIWGHEIPDDNDGPIVIALEQFDPSDNERYIYQDPGEPDRRPNTAQCGHCHQTTNDSWFDSPHRTSASNPRLQDLYAGVAAAFADEGACAAAGGLWSRFNSRCELGDGVLDRLGGGFGACADCHAPGIDGRAGGRDLRDATGVALDYGVHCDVCHHVESVDLTAAAGVAGRLKIARPLEEGPFSLGGGGFLPVTFGPDHDVPNPKMGMVQRDHFRDSIICAGCHQLDQAALVPNQALDPTRWPQGTIPVHSTYQEWRQGPLATSAPCQSCHMPPDPLVANAGDFQRFPFASLGIQGGFLRPAGAVRQHSWIGPRAEGSGILELAAALFVAKRVQAGLLTAEVTVRNVGCGHALPTGEPMRSLVLTVEARCGTDLQPPVGGDAVPDFGGYLASADAGADWSRWPSAQVGDGVRVVRRAGGHHDYAGFGPFSDGTFDAAAKGMPVERYAGTSSVTAVHADGTVDFDQPLPAGDRAYLVKGAALAGAPGFAFARVLSGASGERMVPHYLAVDVASDNRLLPQQRWTSTHEFAVSCADPTVRAVLRHRQVPFGVAMTRGWDLGDRVMTEVSR